ncbi:GABA permease, partial [Acinetobacter baumannii]
MATHQNGSEANHSQSLKHGLKSRHLTMISIAGVIGGSLFVGSGSIIYNTGPVVFLTYALGGLLVWFIMRM